MNAPLKVGVTGGIGSGKSTVCKIFESVGIPVYYADDRAKGLLVEDETLKQEIISLFGAASYAGNQLNRSYLAERVFSDEEELNKMNRVVHPAVAKDFEQFIHRHQGEQVVLKEAALLFETGSYQQLDQNIVVLAKKEIRIQRVLLRDLQRTEEQVLQIMKKQTSDAQRKKLADWQINNNGDELIIPQVLKIYTALTGN